MATRSRYKPDESSCNQLLIGKQLLLAGYELQLRLLRTWHFLLWEMPMLRKPLCWDSIWKLCFYIYVSLWKEIPSFLILAFLKKSIWLSWGKFPLKIGSLPRLLSQDCQALTTWPGAWRTLPSSLSLHLMQEALSFETVARIWGLGFLAPEQRIW